MTNVDHIAKVTVGVVVVIALLFLLAVSNAPKCPLMIKQATMLVEIFCYVLLLQLDGYY